MNICTHVSLYNEQLRIFSIFSSKCTAKNVLLFNHNYQLNDQLIIGDNYTNLPGICIYNIYIIFFSVKEYRQQDTDSALWDKTIPKEISARCAEKRNYTRQDVYEYIVHRDRMSRSLQLKESIQHLLLSNSFQEPTMSDSLLEIVVGTFNSS